MIAASSSGCVRFLTNSVLVVLALLCLVVALSGEGGRSMESVECYPRLRMSRGFAVLMDI